MDERPLLNARVLIVEDELHQLNGIKRDLETISDDTKIKWGLDHFDSDLAMSVEGAKALIGQNQDSIYDLLFLDLGLPEQDGEAAAPFENGQKLLNYICEQKVAKEVIIISSFRDYDYVIKTVRKGAVDFIPKPFDREILQSRVVETWKRILEKDSNKIFLDRIKELSQYNEKGLAYRDSIEFNRFASDVISRVGSIEDHVNDRYGLSRKNNSEEFLIQQLVDLERFMKSARKKWKQMQSPLLPENGLELEKKFNNVGVLDTILSKVEKDLLPCTIIKRVRVDVPDELGIEILTFGDDVRAVIKEILTGILLELPDYGHSISTESAAQDIDDDVEIIKVEIRKKNEQVKIRFTDNRDPIPKEDADRINGNLFVAFDRRFGRAWGLSVMQQIATLGGGRLDIQPQQKRGNVITYLIPQNNNA